MTMIKRDKARASEPVEAQSDGRDELDQLISALEPQSQLTGPRYLPGDVVRCLRNGQLYVVTSVDSYINDTPHDMSVQEPVTGFDYTFRPCEWFELVERGPSWSEALREERVDPRTIAVRAKELRIELGYIKPETEGDT